MPKFEVVKKYYQKLGADEFLLFDPCKKNGRNKINKLKKCDLIHLSGGDTYCFLNSIRKTKFDKFIIDYAKSGGVLVGVSAGAMIMSQTIMATVVKEHHKDSIGLKDYSGLGLSDFEFMAHYDGSDEINEKFIKYSQKSKQPIYACPDNSAIVVDGSNTKFIGNITKFQNGKIIKLKSILELLRI